MGLLDCEIDLQTVFILYIWAFYPVSIVQPPSLSLSEFVYTRYFIILELHNTCLLMTLLSVLSSKSFIFYHEAGFPASPFLVAGEEGVWVRMNVLRQGFSV